MTQPVTALAQWYGGNRTLAPTFGAALDGCNWVGVPFAGGMAELPHIKARTLLVNDLHRHVINLARVVASDQLPALLCNLRNAPFHPDVLAKCQAICRDTQSGDAPDFDLARAYFVCSWMGRAGKSGIDDEFNGRPAVRWNSAGGDSVTRYRSALRMLVTFKRTLRRCAFETMDCFDFLARCEDCTGHGLYVDAPFPGAGRRYRHNAGQTDAEERSWHTRLRDALGRFQQARIVCRFYDIPLIRELYPEPGWAWTSLKGRTQANKEAAEVMLVRNGQEKGLF